MRLELLPGTFAICRLTAMEDATPIPSPHFLAVTDDEVSLICHSGVTPASAAAVSDGWRMLRVAGTLDFGLVGVIAELGAILARAGIAIFVMSTYLTDYLMAKAERMDDAIAALQAAGHTVEPHA